MISVLNEIQKFRHNEIIFDRRNSCRYRVTANETNGRKTSYFFSTPIYNSATKKLLDSNFCKEEKNIRLLGSTADILFSDNILLYADNKKCKISISEGVEYVSPTEIRCGKDLIYPTLNGFAYKRTCTGNSFYMSIETEEAYENVICNGKYFALMADAYKPFMTVSCIGSMDNNGDVRLPFQVSYQKINNFKFVLEFIPNNSDVDNMLFEVNMYDGKLFMDTTVESKNPILNNVYGTTAYVGNSEFFGEQWLYSKPDFYRLSDIANVNIYSAILHIPVLNHFQGSLSIIGLDRRFCSFGSTWENKIGGASLIGHVNANPVTGYIDIDITNLITDKFGFLTMFEGIIIKSEDTKTEPCIISTADSYYTPQILEVQFA